MHCGPLSLSIVLGDVCQGQRDFISTRNLNVCDQLELDVSLPPHYFLYLHGITTSAHIKPISYFHSSLKMEELIGQRFSLISKSEIRYVAARPHNLQHD